MPRLRFVPCRRTETTISGNSWLLNSCIQMLYQLLINARRTTIFTLVRIKDSNLMLVCVNSAWFLRKKCANTLPTLDITWNRILSGIRYRNWTTRSNQVLTVQKVQKRDIQLREGQCMSSLYEMLGFVSCRRETMSQVPWCRMWAKGCYNSTNNINFYWKGPGCVQNVGRFTRRV